MPTWPVLLFLLLAYTIHKAVDPTDAGRRDSAYKVLKLLTVGGGGALLALAVHNSAPPML